MELILAHSREVTGDPLVDVEAFNFSKAAATAPASTGNSAPKKSLESEEWPVEADDGPLFYQPGKKGFYSPRQGRGTIERLNAFRNVGR